MKKLITVKSNLEELDITLDTEKLDGLPIHRCDAVFELLRRYIAAYQRLRHARNEIESAEQELTTLKHTSKGDYFDDDIPFGL